jgi:ADP-ribose pyrophosphatase
LPKKLPYRIKESNLIYQGHIIRLVKDRFVLDVAPDKLVTRELVHHPGAVVIVPMASKNKIVLLRQFRYAAQGDMWEIPAGTREGREKPLLCAKRELEEETGFKARKWSYLTQFYPAPGICNEIMHLFKAETLVKGRKNLDHDEWIEHREVTLPQAYRMIRKGEIKDGKTIVGLLWLSHFS